jgi:hypothetical protein
MFDAGVTFDDVAHAIQLSLAPVFLLTGIAGILNVMAGRLARIIDRGRRLTDTPDEPDPRLAELAIELGSLEQRRHFASSAITACTSAALLTCLVIAALFLEVLTGLRLKWLPGGLFMLATLALVVGLTYFLREVHLATRTVRIPVPKAPPDIDPSSVEPTVKTRS